MSYSQSSQEVMEILHLKSLAKSLTTISLGVENLISSHLLIFLVYFHHGQFQAINVLPWLMELMFGYPEPVHANLQLTSKILLKHFCKVISSSLTLESDIG